MIQNVPSLDRLINELSKLPGVGPKTAARLAYHILKSPESYNKSLQSALEAVSTTVHECSQCYTYTEEENLCVLCKDSSRRKDLLCVVEDPADISRIDSSGAFQGQYHVLHGALSPLDGISPADIRLAPLFARLESGVKEVILALDADLEGDTTVLYIAKQLRDKDIKVTRIAHGIPIGGDIDYIDHRTLGRALENRVEL
ncbi:MAG: recombination mediator RecR [Bdellovibrionota bacterium]